MSDIKVNVFNNFKTTVNHKRIIFPYGKVEALFYYLVVNKSASRDQLATLLWAEMDEKTAKKNLRNALYTVKKLFSDIDVFSFYGLSTVSLNPELTVESDYDAFIQDDDNLESYQGDFLQGCSVKDADEFDRWMHKVRDECKFLYTKRLWDKLDVHKKHRQFLQVEKICRKIIELDEYDESGYIELMSCFKAQQKYANAISVFNELSDFLAKELDVTPNEEAEQVYNDVLDLMNERVKVSPPQQFFFGREKEIRLLESTYHKFVDNEAYESILVRGDMGVGKTRLKQYLTDEIVGSSVNYIEAPCYKFEENYTLRPWKALLVNMLKVIAEEEIILPQTLLDVLGNIAPEFLDEKKDLTKRMINTNDQSNLVDIEDAILEVLKLVSNKKKLVIVFEDIHWMDATSMRLLNSLLVKEELSHCLFVLTMRNDINSDLEEFLVYINNYTTVNVIELKPFTITEVQRFIDQTVFQEKRTDVLYEELYDETEGNVFFLTEYIQAINNNQQDIMMSTKVKDVLKFRFIDLTDKEKKFVELTSLFYKDVPISILKQLMDMDDLELIEIGEALIRKGILKEVTDQQDIRFAFVHQKYSEFQYIQISYGKKKILHNRIGKIIESQLQHHLGDLDLYYKLIFHYERAENNIESLRYRIKSRSMFLNFIHERFPIIHFDNDAFSKLYIGEEDTEKNLQLITDLLDKVKRKHPLNEELPMFEMNVLFLNGRYKIRSGHYEEGLHDINVLIELAKREDHLQFILKGYEQKMCYGIQTCDTATMRDDLAKAQPFINQLSAQSEKGIWYRYEGMYLFLIGQFELAEEAFRKSISIHTEDIETYETYRLSIAACYNDIGVIRKEEGNFSEALYYFERAIAICQEKNLWISISLFHTNAGVTCYYDKNFAEAKAHIERALVIYNKLAFNLNQPLAEIYMCLLLLREKDYKTALYYLKEAEAHAHILKNPRELLRILDVKKAIVNSMETNKSVYHVFHRYLHDFKCSDYEKERHKILKLSPPICHSFKP
ncbi:AAA family ATPase [Lentibacillus saliphilus]|uniref:AAA family ATPase n=1 Tax=Lentibacillus saliphilus TaxID=2737028 RepID=UPI001C3075D5|nr:AAA family ATPase [Lentibacillus saliphilus]